MSEWTNIKLLEIFKMTATRIDFDLLIADSVLRKHTGARCELADLARLPEHARRKNTHHRDVKKDAKRSCFIP
jgi:hypothetical protein